MFNPFEVTEDGFEMHLQVNYLGHFLLTALLLPLINKSVQGRIVNVSAHSHSAGTVALDDPLNVDAIASNGAESFHSRDAFSHSKLAIILATRFWAQRLDKTKIMVNCCSPGLVRGTGHFRKWVEFYLPFFIKRDQILLLSNLNVGAITLINNIYKHLNNHSIWF